MIPLKDVMPCWSREGPVEHFSSAAGAGEPVPGVPGGSVGAPAPYVKEWAAGHTFTSIADLRACAYTHSISVATLPDTTVRDNFHVMVGVEVAPGLRVGCAGWRGSDVAAHVDEIPGFSMQVGNRHTSTPTLPCDPRPRSPLFRKTRTNCAGKTERGWGGSRAGGPGGPATSTLLAWAHLCPRRCARCRARRHVPRRPRPPPALP
jgi:hypothetical protein